MRLRQMELFAAVVEHGSIRRAAEALNMAQPSVSSQLVALETEVGGALMNRHARGVTLTPAGRVFLREARATLTAADRARRFTAQAMEGASGDVVFATVMSVAAGILPSALASWRKARPDARAYMHEYRSSADLSRATSLNQHDFAVGPEPLGTFEFQTYLGSEEFVVVLPEGDPVAQEAAVDIRDLANRPWVMFSNDHGLSQIMTRLFADAGIRPDCAVSTSQTEVAVRLAAVGLGPTIVPANVIPAPYREFARSFKEPWHRSLYVYSQDPLSDLAAALVEDIRAVLSPKSDSQVLSL
ncbi:LysR family transcriptional regulator [Sphingobium naphthae]|nr:LysR family transcriptional regulator [Sphingobium naphthae]